MRKKVYCLSAAVCLCLIMAGCAGQTQSAADTVSDAVATETGLVPETTKETAAPSIAEEVTAAAEEKSVPTETVSEASAPDETVPEASVPSETVSRDAREPVMTLPEVSDEPSDFFSDAAFIGDSISYSLFVYQNKTKELGDALFLVRGSLSLQNTLIHYLKVFYQGKEMTPWEALEASGAKKVFIMLGTNDIGYYGIDETMERWTVFVENIREACPDIQIYIQSLTPMWTEAEQKLLNNENIDIYNQQLETFAENNGCYFVNIAPYFKDSTNGLAANYCSDQYVHMSEEGVSAWVKLLKAYAAEQKKERA